VNKKGHKDSLVAAHPGNFSAVKHGAHSERLISARADEISAELTAQYEFAPAALATVAELARLMAIQEALMRDADVRGVVDERGKPRATLDYQLRVSRQIAKLLEQLAPSTT